MKQVYLVAIVALLTMGSDDLNASVLKRIFPTSWKSMQSASQAYRKFLAETDSQRFDASADVGKFGLKIAATGLGLIGIGHVFQDSKRALTLKKLGWGTAWTGFGIYSLGFGLSAAPLTSAMIASSAVTFAATKAMMISAKNKNKQNS